MKLIKRLKLYSSERKNVVVVCGVLYSILKTEGKKKHIMNLWCCVKNKLVLSGKCYNKPGKNKIRKSLLASLSTEVQAKGGEA